MVKSLLSILVELNKEESNMSQEREVVDRSDEQSEGWSSSSDEEEVDPEYNLQIEKYQGFNIDDHVIIPRWGIRPCNLGNCEPPAFISLYGQLGVHCFNNHKGRYLKTMRIPKYNVEIFNCSFHFYITVDVEDLADHSRHTFQTMITEAFPRSGSYFNILTKVCRLKPNTPEPFPEYEREVDEFCTRRMPNFLTHVPCADRLRFYEVREQDILENDWLTLYTEYALYGYLGDHSSKLESSLPVKINKILMETSETHEEPCMKLKSSNAIFYINFSAQSRDYRSVVRRITYKSGNMLLQINSEIVEQNKTESVF